MKYPNKELYEILYAKWLARETDLTDYADLREGMNCLDLCCGGMRLTKKIASKTLNTVFGIDENEEMMPSVKEIYLFEKQFNNNSVKIVPERSNIASYFSRITCEEDKYSYIFCQQAINYWIKEFFSIDYNFYFYRRRIDNFNNSFKKNGILIFNTFNTKPENFSRKIYKFQQRNYEEINCLYNNKVYHVQLCNEYPPHETVFDWISREEFYKILSPYFHIKIITKGTSDIYICQKK